LCSPLRSNYAQSYEDVRSAEAAWSANAVWPAFMSSVICSRILDGQATGALLAKGSDRAGSVPSH
jgi:hypothetical protein